MICTRKTSLSWRNVFVSLGLVGLFTLGQYCLSHCVLQEHNLKINEAISASVAVVGLLMTVFSYNKYKEEQKIKLTSLYNKEYRTNPNIQDVLAFLIGKEENKGDKKVDVQDINKREMFLRFFEEIQHLIDQKLMDEAEAKDLFSYYAKEAWKLGDKFIPGFEGEKDTNWRTLKKFVGE